MRPPIPRSARWIDQHWGAIDKIFPSFTMDWLYQEYGPYRLKHHRWMLTRPSFLVTARQLHEALATGGDRIIAAVTERGDFPDGLQRVHALRLFRRLQRPDGIEVTQFLAATACEMLGSRPWCKYDEAALAQWTAEALAENVFPPYGNAYNLLFNVVSQTMLWVLGCVPYAALRQQITSSSHDLAFWIDMDPPEVEHRRLLRQYCLTLNAELTRIGRRRDG